MGHLHRKGFDYVIQRLVFGATYEVQESRSPTSLVRARPEIASRLPPMLLIHCTGDKISPQAQSEAFFAALSEARAPDVHFVLQEGGGHNDPVIHSPLMSDTGIIRAIILNVWRWGAKDTTRAAEGKHAPRCCKVGNAPGCCKAWESTAELACQDMLDALPSWPRLPKVVINAARRLTPF